MKKMIVGEEKKTNYMLQQVSLLSRKRCWVPSLEV